MSRVVPRSPSEFLSIHVATSKVSSTTANAFSNHSRSRRSGRLIRTQLIVNRTRADFAEKFEALIESYNAGSRSIEKLFEELVKLSNSLND